MHKLVSLMSAVALVLPAAVPVAADAAPRGQRHAHAGHGHRHYHACRKSRGTTGLIAGGVVGVLAGPAILGHGLIGAVAGGAGGALGGRAIDRTLTAPKRCR